jgi:transposase
MNVVYRVDLSAEECIQLNTLVASKAGAQKRKRAQVLLAASKGIADATIAKTLPCGLSTVYRTKKRFVTEGLEACLTERPGRGASRKLTKQEEANLVALACSTPPEGRRRWTLELLAGELIRLVEHETVSRETIRRRLRENDLKPWQRKMWCVPKVDAEYVARMEDVLELYTEPPNARFPVISFDETPTQLIGEARLPVPQAPGRPARIDYEYRRNGTANLFVFVDAHRSWRHVKVTDHRTGIDFAHCMRELSDKHYPHAERIRVVLDNLSTHRAKNLYEAFPPEEARRILRRLEFHYTPTHASWLNMVEIEISVLASQCLDRRIPDRIALEREVAAWQNRRNAQKARIKWMFDAPAARRKLGKLYPTPTSAPSALDRAA